MERFRRARTRRNIPLDKQRKYNKDTWRASSHKKSYKENKKSPQGTPSPSSKNKTEGNRHSQDDHPAAGDDDNCHGRLRIEGKTFHHDTVEGPDDYQGKGDVIPADKHENTEYHGRARHEGGPDRLRNGTSPPADKDQEGGHVRYSGHGYPSQVDADRYPHAPVVPPGVPDQSQAGAEIDADQGCQDYDHDNKGEADLHMMPCQDPCPVGHTGEKEEGRQLRKELPALFASRECGPEAPDGEKGQQHVDDEPDGEGKTCRREEVRQYL